MTKAEVIRSVARVASITNLAAETAVNRIRDIIVEEVMAAGRFALDGVGIFTVAQRAARDGRNPQTGDPVKIPAKKVVKFGRPGRSRKQRRGKEGGGYGNKQCTRNGPPSRSRRQLLIEIGTNRGKKGVFSIRLSKLYPPFLKFFIASSNSSSQMCV
jgi:DNA-binding protein HU-beta